MIASVSPGAVELRPWSDYGWWACRARDNPDPAAGSPEEGKKHTVTHAMPRDELTPTPRRLRATGVILMASVQYVICTIIAASAWKNPSYDWFNNYISDLGFRTCGMIAMRYACSPLHDLMNMSLIVQGIITVAAVIVGIRIVPRHRVGIAIAGVMTGIGIACVGFFPGSIEGGATGGLPIHGLSALVAVLAGDATLLMLGLAVWHRSRRAGILLIAVVALSFTSMLWVTFAPPMLCSAQVCPSGLPSIPSLSPASPSAGTSSAPPFRRRNPRAARLRSTSNDGRLSAALRCPRRGRHLRGPHGALLQRGLGRCADQTPLREADRTLEHTAHLLTRPSGRDLATGAPSPGDRGHGRALGVTCGMELGTA